MENYIDVLFDEDNYPPTVDDVVYSYLRQRLNANQWDVCKTAEEVKIGKSTLYRHIKNSNIKPKSVYYN